MHIWQFERVVAALRVREYLACPKYTPLLSRHCKVYILVLQMPKWTLECHCRVVDVAHQDDSEVSGVVLTMHYI